MSTPSTGKRPQPHAEADHESTAPSLGFWSCWSLTVGIMVGSGVFLLPAVLAPYGLMSFSGWLLSGAGSILLALVFARLSSRTTKSGGVYVYSQEAFGDVVGFLIAWGYWCCYWIAIPAAAIAFVGYLAVFIPGIAQHASWQAMIALSLIWLAGVINLKGIEEAAFVQLLMTVLKLLPLLLIIGLGLSVGDSANLPEMNPQDMPWQEGLAITALLTLWAFSGMEAAAMPASDVKDPERTIPRAIVVGTITVSFIYIASTAAVMLLVPSEQLANSTAPFADAAASLGTWGPALIAIGAMVSTFGSLNGILFVTGQMPMAVAVDKLAPRWLARRNKGGAPQPSLILAIVLASVLLLANYSGGLVKAYEFLITMSTLTFLLPLIASSIAEFKYSWRSARGWAAVALLAFLYSIFAVAGSGLTVFLLGLGLLALGLPVYYFGRQSKSDH